MFRDALSLVLSLILKFSILVSLVEVCVRNNAHFPPQASATCNETRPAKHVGPLCGGNGRSNLPTESLLLQPFHGDIAQKITTYLGSSRQTFGSMLAAAKIPPHRAPGMPGVKTS